MKRGGGDFTQGEGHAKHARYHTDASGSSVSMGSRTAVRQAAVLALQSSTESEDMTIQESHTESAQEDGDDEDSDDDSGLEDGPTSEVRMVCSWLL